MRFLILDGILLFEIIGQVKENLAGNALIACSILIAVFVLIIAIEKATDKICDSIKKKGE